MNNTTKEQISAYYDIWISSNSIYDKWAKKHNISSNSLFTLWVIYNTPENCSQQEICEKLQLPKQTVNAILNSLENHGYIERVACTTDKRSKNIVFTNNGLKYAETILNDLYQFEESAFQIMDKNDLSVMFAHYNNLLNNLKLILETQDTP